MWWWMLEVDNVVVVFCVGGGDIGGSMVLIWNVALNVNQTCAFG